MSPEYLIVIVRRLRTAENRETVLAVADDLERALEEWTPRTKPVPLPAPESGVGFELPPLALVEDRTPEQLAADGDDTPEEHHDLNTPDGSTDFVIE